MTTLLRVCAVVMLVCVVVLGFMMKPVCEEGESSFTDHCSNPDDEEAGEEGRGADESCFTSEDCQNGLRCVDGQCFEPSPEAVRLVQSDFWMDNSDRRQRAVEYVVMPIRPGTDCQDLEWCDENADCDTGWKCSGHWCVVDHGR